MQVICQNLLKLFLVYSFRCAQVNYSTHNYKNTLVYSTGLHLDMMNVVAMDNYTQVYRLQTLTYPTAVYWYSNSIVIDARIYTRLIQKCFVP